jgi:hypothetical protein
MMNSTFSQVLCADGNHIRRPAAAADIGIWLCIETQQAHILRHLAAVSSSNSFFT